MKFGEVQRATTNATPEQIAWMLRGVKILTIVAAVFFFLQAIFGITSLSELADDQNEMGQMVGKKLVDLIVFIPSIVLMFMALREPSFNILAALSITLFISWVLECQLVAKDGDDNDTSDIDSIFERGNFCPPMQDLVDAEKALNQQINPAINQGDVAQCKVSRTFGGFNIIVLFLDLALASILAYNLRNKAPVTKPAPESTPTFEVNKESKA